MAEIATYCMKRRILPVLLVAGVGFSSAGALAQTVDYGSLQALFGEPVTTTATGKPQKASEAPVAMEIVTSDQIRRHGVTSIPEILNRVPGLTNWQATRFSSDVGIRGQNTAYNQTLLVLLNGRQVYIDVNGYTDWSLLPVQLEEIRQIEIVKGPTTALYGFNAVSGVVNIVTYNPTYDDHGAAGLIGGTGDYGRAYGFNTVKLSDKASIRISGDVEHADEFGLHSKTTYAETGTFRDDHLNRRVMADGMFQVADNTQLRLQLSHADSDKTDAFYQVTGAPSDKYFSSANATLVSDTSLGQIQGNLYINRYQEDFNSSLIDATIDNQVVVAQLSDLFKVGTDHTFRLGAEYRHNSIKSDEFVAPGAKVFYDLVAASGMWSWALTPELEWTNALRMDYLMLDRSGPFLAPEPYPDNSVFDRNIAAYSFNSGIVWKATELDTLRASYGRGVGAPSLVDFGVHSPIPFTPIVIAGNPNLDPTVVHNFEVGYARLLEDIDGQFRSSLFYKRIGGLHSIASSTFPSGSSIIIGGAEFGDSQTAGLELELRGTIGSQWSWDTSYIYQNSVDDLTGTITATTTPHRLRYENTIPHHVLKGHLGYSTGPWEADIYGELASHFEALEYRANAPFGIVQMDSYYTLGGRLGYTFDNTITVALSGSELAQARVTNNYGLENERRVFLSLSKPF